MQVMQTVPVLQYSFASLHCKWYYIGLEPVVWHFDGNVPCFGARHILLFVISITCEVTVIEFTFSLLLVQCLQRRAICSVSGGLKSLDLFLKPTLVLVMIIITFGLVFFRSFDWACMH